VETRQAHDAAMWGPCRDTALQREVDERAAGYDAGTQQAALTWTYKDCVAADRRMNVHSVYDASVPASRAGSAAGY